MIMTILLSAKYSSLGRRHAEPVSAVARLEWGIDSVHSIGAECLLSSIYGRQVG